MSGSGISWAICKSTTHSRQITTSVPHHLSVLQAGCPSCRPTNSIKALSSFEQNVWRRISLKTGQVYYFVSLVLYLAFTSSLKWISDTAFSKILFNECGFSGIKCTRIVFRFSRGTDRGVIMLPQISGWSGKRDTLSPFLNPHSSRRRIRHLMISYVNRWQS